MKIIPIIKMDKVNIIISKILLEAGEYRIIANPYKLVKIKKIPSAYPNFLLKFDNPLFCYLFWYMKFIPVLP